MPKHQHTKAAGDITHPFHLGQFQLYIHLQAAAISVVSRHYTDHFSTTHTSYVGRKFNRLQRCNYSADIGWLVHLIHSVCTQLWYCMYRFNDRMSHRDSTLLSHGFFHEPHSIHGCLTVYWQPSDSVKWEFHRDRKLDLLYSCTWLNRTWAIQRDVADTLL